MSDEGRRPCLIGLTGNIATGKSTVAAMLAELGAQTIDADQVAHQVMRPGRAVYQQVVDAFGQRVVAPGGGIDRQALAGIVFGDSEALRRLERIVHPAVAVEVDRRIAQARSRVVVVEAIKLIEAGMAQWCETLWVTWCRPEQQIERLMEGRGLSRSQAWQRVRAQPPQGEKVAAADVVIDTSGSLSQTRQQVEKAWQDSVAQF